MAAKEAITIAWTGASGAPYGWRLAQVLTQLGYPIHLLISKAALVVLATEMQQQLPPQPAQRASYLAKLWQVDEQLIQTPGRDDWFSVVASGSSAPKKMVICPCSAGTLAAVAHGLSDNLIERAADVVLKERGQLILVPRETPFSTLHLQNMLALSQLGAVIMPAAPGFYHQPQSIEQLVDFMVARILDHLGITHQLSQRWGYQAQ